MIPVTLSLRSAAVVWCLFLSSVDWGLWTLTLCLIIHCCAVARSSQPWLLHSLGRTDHKGSGWPALSCLKHWQQLYHPIPSHSVPYHPPITSSRSVWRSKVFFPPTEPGLWWLCHSWWLLRMKIWRFEIAW